jgi:hypothetical protein
MTMSKNSTTPTMTVTTTVTNNRTAYEGFVMQTNR